jgi:hypothetical protein
MEEGKRATMKQVRTEAELDSLLARGGIGAVRRDAILETVLARVEVERPSGSRRRWVFAVFGAAGAVAAFLLLVSQRSTDTPAQLRAKGPATQPSTTAPSADIDCLGATLDRCPSGSLVLVRVTGVRGFVSAWAEPAGGGERIWYFSADSFSPSVDAMSTTAVATTRAIKIGPEHRSGTYLVQVRVTERPMARDELLHLPANAVLAKGASLLRVTSP